MRYSISEDVSFEEATPRGLLTVAFKAGEIDAEPGSDEQYAIEYVLIPNGMAAVVPEGTAPIVKTKRARKPKLEAPVAPAPADPPAAPVAPDAVPFIPAT